MPGERDELRKILNEAASKDNKIDGVVIFDDELDLWMQSETAGASGYRVDPDNFVVNVGRHIKQSLMSAEDMGTGKPKYIMLFLEKALWTIFLSAVAQKEFLLVFVLSENNAEKYRAEHRSNCLKYKPKIERLLEYLVR
ncbi:MAG: hypothetical protein AB4352_21780 [Hormoscilla sp.]